MFDIIAFEILCKAQFLRAPYVRAYILYMCYMKYMLSEKGGRGGLIATVVYALFVILFVSCIQ